MTIELNDNARLEQEGVCRDCGRLWFKLYVTYNFKEMEQFVCTWCMKVYLGEDNWTLETNKIRNIIFQEYKSCTDEAKRAHLMSQILGARDDI